MVDLPALEPHVPVVLQADLAVDHVRLSVIPSLTVAEAALGTMVVPERLDGLLNDGGHEGLSRWRLRLDADEQSTGYNAALNRWLTHD